MSQVTFNVSYYNYVTYSNANYYTCRDASSGASLGYGVLRVGQGLGTGTYQIWRGFIYFDTSGIPGTAIITAATIQFTLPLSYDYSDTDFNIIVRGAETAHNPLELGDYDLTHYNGDNLGELTDNTPTIEGDYRSYTLNINGRLYINRGGITQFVLLSKEDIDNDPPIAQENVWYWIINFTNITLTVTYFEPTEAPTVETINEACEDRQSTTLTAVGEITGTGDGYTFRGFEYYQYDTEYISSMYAVREIGTFATPCIYRMTLYGLKPATVYWIRAYAGNIFGIGYGEWVLCATTGVQVGTYEIYEETNPATICFYVSEDSGHTWSLKFGPYTTDQADIAITKILVRGSGKKQIKFTTDALTGLSASVMCKVDVKI